MHATHATRNAVTVLPKVTSATAASSLSSAPTTVKLSEITLQRLNANARESNRRCQALSVGLATQFVVFLACFLAQIMPGDWQNLLFSALVGSAAACLHYAILSQRDSLP